MATTAHSRDADPPSAPWERGEQQPPAGTRLERAGWAILLALPGALTLYTGVHAGGFFAGTQGMLAAGIAVALVLRIVLAQDPLGGAAAAVAVASGALALLAVWTLASAQWSGAPARALIEFDRTLLYLLVLVLFGTLPMTVGGLRWMVRGMALGVLAVCVLGLVSRVLPELLPSAPNVVASRLSYPVTYWNGLGLLAVLGVLLALHLACAPEPRPIRVAAAAALPLLAATMLLTFSRGAIGAGVFGVLAYLVLGRPRLAASGLLSVVPATAFALSATYGANALATDDLTAPAALAQGRELARTLVLCVLWAALVRGTLLALDARLLAREARRLGTRTRIGVWAGGAAAALLAFVALGGPALAARQIEGFATRGTLGETGDVRDRLTAAGGNGRIEHWEVALRGFRSAPLTGHGAGTFQLTWELERPTPFQVVDAHSLYLEMLDELGVVGMALLATALIALLAGLARRVRGPDRALFALLLALAAVWTLRAGADWDWEMPVVTLWLFALGGAALATPVDGRRRAPGHGPSRGARLALAVGLLAVATIPARMAVSQRHLDAAVKAFERRDCPAAIDSALSSSEVLGVRPEPHQIVGLCDVALGRPDLAVRAVGQAAALDPGNWEYHYGLALVRGAARQDPLPQARLAARLNPQEWRARAAVRRFATRDPSQWRSRALSSPLPEGYLPRRPKSAV